MNDRLFARAKKVQRESNLLRRQFAALRELRTLDNDFRSVRNRLVRTMQITEAAVPYTAAGMHSLLAEAEEVLAPPPAA